MIGFRPGKKEGEASADRKPEVAVADAVPVQVKPAAAAKPALPTLDELITDQNDQVIDFRHDYLADRRRTDPGFEVPFQQSTDIPVGYWGEQGPQFLGNSEKPREIFLYDAINPTTKQTERHVILLALGDWEEGLANNPSHYSKLYPPSP